MKPSECIKKGWIKGRLAIDNQGSYCSPIDPRACGWCTVGAIRKCFNNDGYCDAFYKLLFEKIRNKYNKYSDIEEFNDAPSRTKEEVIEVLEEAEKEYYATK